MATLKLLWELGSETVVCAPILPVENRSAGSDMTPIFGGEAIAIFFLANELFGTARSTGNKSSRAAGSIQATHAPRSWVTPQYSVHWSCQGRTTQQGEIWHATLKVSLPLSSLWQLSWQVQPGAQGTQEQHSSWDRVSPGSTCTQ